MGFEEFVEETVAACEQVKDWITFSPAARKTMAVKYSHYAYSLMAAFPLYLPVSEEAMLCNVSDWRDQPAYVVMTSAVPFVTSLPIATMTVTTTSTGNTFIRPL